MSLNVLGTTLQFCSTDPMTGWRRDGFCRTDEADFGTHIVCAKMTQPFLSFTFSKGNDLITPSAGFPGLKPGDSWCVCVLRWIEAYNAGVAPPINLRATSMKALDYIPKNIILQYGI
jgi:uncharacterized protein (DUF2237 family)